MTKDEAYEIIHRSLFPARETALCTSAEHHANVTKAMKFTEMFVELGVIHPGPKKESCTMAHFEIREDDSLNYNVYDLRLDRWVASFRLFADAKEFATAKITERRSLLQT